MPTLPKWIDALHPYVPGKPIETVAREYGLDPNKIAKLASNENPLGVPKAVQEAIASHAAGVYLYPDGAAFDLRRKVAEKSGIDDNWIIFGNGCVEIIEMVAKAFLDQDDHSMYSQYAFPMYKIATFATNHVGKEIPSAPEYRHDLNAFIDAIDDHTKVIFIANPNNPTTTMLTQKQMDDFVDKVPDRVLVVLDEAYFEYMDHPDYPDSMRYIREQERKNVIILRTFSKIYGLAGLRVGYGFAHPDLIHLVEKVRSPFNVNLLGQVACIAALDCDAHVKASRDHVLKEKAFVTRGLDEMGLPYMAEQGNFLMVDTGRDAAETFVSMQKQGVIVRPLKGFGLTQHIRMSYGTRQENQAFLSALKSAIQA